MKNKLGFTLLEIMIAVAIIAIIVAAVTPVFLGMRRTAQIRAAQNEVDIVAAAYVAYYADNPTTTFAPDNAQMEPGFLERQGYLEAGHNLPARVRVILAGGRYYVEHIIHTMKDGNAIRRELGRQGDFVQN